MTVKIEEGRYYRTRAGEKVGPIVPHNEEWFRTDYCSRLWDRDGNRYGGDPDTELVAEWAELLQLRQGAYYRDAEGRWVGPMRMWSDGVDHPFDNDGSNYEIYRPDGSSEFVADLIAEWPIEQDNRSLADVAAADSSRIDIAGLKPGDVVHARGIVGEVENGDPLIDFGSGYRKYLPASAIFHVEPRPLAVGDVTDQGAILALHGDRAWVERPEGPHTFRLDDLKAA